MVENIFNNINNKSSTNNSNAKRYVTDKTNKIKEMMLSSTTIISRLPQINPQYPNIIFKRGKKKWGFHQKFTTRTHFKLFSEIQFNHLRKIENWFILYIYTYNQIFTMSPSLSLSYPCIVSIPIMSFRQFFFFYS